MAETLLAERDAEIVRLRAGLSHAEALAFERARMGSRVSIPMALRLLRLMLSPKGGKALRARARTVFRSEGLGGFAKRLQGPRG